MALTEQHGIQFVLDKILLHLSRGNAFNTGQKLCNPIKQKGTSSLLGTGSVAVDRSVYDTVGPLHFTENTHTLIRHIY